ncbi:UrcA family protein [uncultured Sphingomonas sp.]|uniref:UrcA family protein n=1 Tax=uncultured Sphingomonas sp. TaxID=158754 RepID=UPI00261B25C0|nr:UrcA family protein [uncultured Sphingomonas sp.]
MNTSLKIAVATALSVVAMPGHAERVTVKAPPDQVRTMRISYADLNMSSDEGVRRLTMRAKGAARWVCDVSEASLPIAEEQAEQRCFNASFARARNDIAMVQQQIRTNIASNAASSGAIEVAQR